MDVTRILEDGADSRIRATQPEIPAICMDSTYTIKGAFRSSKKKTNNFKYNVFYQIFRNLRRDPLKLNFTPKFAPVDLHGRPTHPVFAAASLNSYVSIMETDYNIHKSNSTYFADMDISRTAAVTPLYTPGAGIVSKELDEEIAAAAIAEGKPAPKKKLPMFIALGATYCSFKREIKPLQRFELRSHVAAWDEKWMYIVTVFLIADKKKGAKKGGQDGGGDWVE